MLPLDLHVLSLQLAFILSQDQTLHCKSIVSQHKAGSCSVQDAVQFIDFINTLRLTHIYIYIRQVLTVLFFSCTTCIVYQYFKELVAFALKAGAKVRALFLTTKLFRKFFSFSFYAGFSGSLCERERRYERITLANFLCESDCKDKNFQLYLPNFIGSFFVLMVKQTLAFTLSQFIKAFFSWKAGAKVRPFGIHSKYIKLFFLIIFEYIC